jgi:hypothetical protein
MDLLGTIRPGDSAEVERSVWVALISAHSFLASVAPRRGINPFTKKPHTFEAPPDSARIVLDSMDVGAAIGRRMAQIAWSYGRLLRQRFALQ